MRKLTSALIITAALASANVALAQNAVMVGGQSMLPSKDIIDNAVNSADHTTLVAAVKAAGLVETLKGEGPFTVFAPTNTAFEKLEKKIGKEKFAAVLKDKKTLTAILTYHVIPGKVMAADVVKLKNKTQVKTVQGATITVGNKHGVKINKAKVIKTDIEASNGVIHVIDAVLLPPTKKH